MPNVSFITVRGICRPIHRGQGNASITQYYQFDSLQDVEEKLAQFPKGTQFALAAAGPVEVEAAAIRKLAAARGLVIVTR